LDVEEKSVGGSIEGTLQAEKSTGKALRSQKPEQCESRICHLQSGDDLVQKHSRKAAALLRSLVKRLHFMTLIGNELAVRHLRNLTSEASGK
jgi:hypothetical protein